MPGCALKKPRVFLDVSAPEEGWDNAGEWQKIPSGNNLPDTGTDPPQVLPAFLYSQLRQVENKLVFVIVVFCFVFVFGWKSRWASFTCLLLSGCLHSPFCDSSSLPGQTSSRPRHLSRAPRIIGLTSSNVRPTHRNPRNLIFVYLVRKQKATCQHVRAICMQPLGTRQSFIKKKKNGCQDLGGGAGAGDDGYFDTMWVNVEQGQISTQWLLRSDAVPPHSHID